MARRRHKPTDPHGKALRQVDRRVARAIRDHGLLGDGDNVLVAVSGGKDSLVLLDALTRRRAWRPEDYGLVACHVVDGSCYDGCGYARTLRGHCADLGVPLRVIHERTVPTEDELSSGVRPCWLCSWRRRKLLVQQADQEGCNLVALGHHKDDFAETLLLNLMWQGRHEGMLPRQPLFGGRITLIRPLALTDEEQITRVAALAGLPRHDCACPHADDSRRETAREIIRLARSAGVRDVTSNLVRTIFQPTGRREAEGKVAGRVTVRATDP